MIFLYLTTPAGAVIGVEQPQDLLEILKLLGYEKPTLEATSDGPVILTTPEEPIPANPRPLTPRPKPVQSIRRSDSRRRPQPNSNRSVIRRAFAEDPTCSLPLLCEKIYGSSNGANMMKLRSSIGSLCHEGKLERIAAGEYRVVEDADGWKEAGDDD